ncbi:TRANSCRIPTIONAL REGULATOR PROTEIN HCNGP [Salix koriyanagi]|uniref:TRANSCRIPTIONAL REGULATOR PROTEIN HCNGP n=1 Tax=Salix koriyanagi TaxID=2511006 RepID=A0A9Q0UEI1_9ROSI|nr:TRANSCRIPTIONAL REGULATOR PROTEIN HCNGP [Salix koriyanagi]
MASRKKHLEGIALLSMYNDDEEDDDEEMEDHDHQPNQSNDMEQDTLHDDNAMLTEELQNTEEAEAPTASRNSTPEGSLLRPLTPLQQQQQQGGAINLEAKRSSSSSRRGRLAIVDYGHDEVAMSPEPEEGEFEEELESTSEKSSPATAQILSPSVRATPQSSEHLEPSQPGEINDSTKESEAVNAEDSNEVPAAGVDLLDKFLPPPPKEKCPQDLQKKIDKFLSLKKIGRSFNAEVRNRKDYRNPDFLLHAVRYQDIDQIGSCFSKDVFDPHGYDQSDYYLDIEADMRRERERKEHELKRSPKVEFVSGGSQPGVVVPPTKFSVPIPVVTASGTHSSANAADAAPREGRQNKKSKWDKVDGDGRNPLPSGGQDSLAAAAALLSVANVGTGYTGFVRSGERRKKKGLEKGSWKEELELLVVPPCRENSRPYTIFGMDRIALGNIA